ncbi:E3 ubiquitin-protein ligase TRIM39-like isoform X1 [Pleurodeles waltl]|uniref:E3 ubiquitin-protein ligase TRIM39-like isoform X1 n=1 Tax=Pleurodeles waltl TaxID=8319 RepID=UPI0037095898
MATARPEENLQNEIICAICLGYFKEPVTTDCGHNFCRSCIRNYWEVQFGNGICPQCRHRSELKILRVNTQLANIVASIQQLQMSPRHAVDANICQEHEETLKLFCHDDLTPICVVCDRSVRHRTHNVLPINEAVVEYKESFKRLLEPLKRQLQNLKGWTTNKKHETANLEAKFKIQSENISNEFEEFQRYLDDQKRLLLTSLEDEKKELLNNLQGKIAKLQEQHSSLQKLITDIETKPDLEFLKEVKNNLSRCEHFKNHTPEENSPELEKNLKSFNQHYPNLKKALLRARETFVAELEWKKAQRFAGDITLDPHTANPWLILSDQGKSVGYGDRAQDLTRNPERYDSYAFVLGQESLTSGKHYWEVEVGKKTSWTLGVCDESQSRKGSLILEPQRGYWVIRLIDNCYQANTTPCTPLTPCVRPSKVGIYLNYEAGMLSFYNVKDRSLLYSFIQAPFPRTLRACFSPSISDSGRNANPLRILPVRMEE